MDDTTVNNTIYGKIQFDKYPESKIVPARYWVDRYNLMGKVLTRFPENFQGAGT